MNKILILISISIFISNCSFNKNSKIWSNEKLVKEKALFSKVIFKEAEILNKQIFPNLKVKIKSKPNNNKTINLLSNNYGRINFSSDLSNISKYKFSKIKSFENIEPNIAFDNDSLIFFDNKGSILKFDNNTKLIWKKNPYNKTEKKLKPRIFFANNSKHLIVTDNISKYYSMNIKTGELHWMKSHDSAFNSQVKIYDNKFFAVDNNNVLTCFSIVDGKKIWKIRTENNFIRSSKKLSIVIINNSIIFSNSVGDIGSIDISTGSLNWLTPTRSNLIKEEAFFLKISDLVANNNSIYFSNNKNEFFSLNVNNGLLNWKININSSVRPVIIDNMIFTVTNEGYLSIIDKTNGNLIRVTDLFESLKKKKRSKIKPIGFIVGTENIYLTTNNGRLFVVEILNGKTKVIFKIDNNSLSRPFVSNNNMFIIKENSIVRIN